MQNRRGGDRRDRRPHDRPGRAERGPRENRGPREERGYAPREERGYAPREERGYPPREERGRFGAPRPRQDRFGPRDEGGMSLRLDPRRLRVLKDLAGERGMRPGELVTQWVEERIDAERSGAAPRPAAPSAPDLTAQLSARIDDLERRVEALSTPASEAAAAAPDALPEEPAKPRRGRRSTADADGKGPRVALHDEIIAVINERGPLTAGELADAITERGRYSAPRSNKPLDAATVSARVSNPVYRDRFRREDGRIGLAES